MTTIYVLIGRAPDGHERTRRYYVTEQAARDVLPDLVLSGELRTPCTIEPVEVHGGDLPEPTAGARARPEDAERERRRVAVEEAAGRLVDWWPHGGGITRERALRLAVDDLRGHAPAEVVAPEPAQPPVAPSDELDELDRIAPRPWRTDGECKVLDSNGERLLMVEGRTTTKEEDERLAELLVQLVNAARPDEHRAERDALIEAARAWGDAIRGGDYDEAVRLACTLSALTAAEKRAQDSEVTA